MLDVISLLDRPGLDSNTRAMIIAKAAIWPGDWERLSEVLHVARDRGMARYLFEETLLQGVLFFGFPRSVTAFGVLQAAWPSASSPSAGAIPTDEQAQKGLELFDAIYGKNSANVHAMLMQYHAEFHDFVIESAYGRVLCRPALGPRERELLAASTLAAMDQTPQFVAHARGARHFGASPHEIEEALATVLSDEDQIEQLMRRV